MSRLRPSLLLAVRAALLPPLLVAAVAAAGPPAPSAGNGSTGAALPDQALDQFVKRLVVEHVPRSVDKLDGWGRTREIVSGLDVRREGLEIRTHRRHKQVYDGTWKWYRCELVDPQRDLDIHITPRPDASDGGKQFDVAATARVRVLAQVQQWETGVRLASISTQADAVVRLDLGCRLKVELDTKQFPPDLLLEPRVERAEVRLLDLDVERISKLRGDLAEELGRTLRPIIDREIARRQTEIVPKLNAKLAQRQGQGQFRFSLSDWAAGKWSDWWGSTRNGSPAK